MQVFANHLVFVSPIKCGMVETRSAASTNRSRTSNGIQIASIKINRTRICNKLCCVKIAEASNKIGTTAVTIVQTRTRVSNLNQGLLRNLIAGKK